MRRDPLRDSIIGLVCCALVPGSLPGQTLHSSEHPVYANKVYEYRVTLPREITYVRTEAPSPDHGFSVQLSQATTLWTDASYSDSKSTSDEMKRQTDGCGVREDKDALLGGKRARTVFFSCPANRYGPAYLERMTLTVSVGRGRAPIYYQVTVRTNSEQIDDRAEALFRAVVAGFRFNPSRHH